MVTSLCNFNVASSHQRFSFTLVQHCIRMQQRKTNIAAAMYNAAAMYRTCCPNEQCCSNMITLLQHCILLHQWDYIAATLYIAAAM